MERIEITKSFSNSGSRNDVRMRVVNEFAKESPGYGNKDKASRYIYYVETLEDGDRIYLQRPANLHNGFDFLVCVENINYAEGTGKRRRNYPKHTDIETDLVNKKNENLELYCKLYDLIDDVYNCKDISSNTCLSIRRKAEEEARRRLSTFKNMPFLHVEGTLLEARRAFSLILYVTF